jgi:hypothetical protein
MSSFEEEDVLRAVGVAELKIGAHSRETTLCFLLFGFLWNVAGMCEYGIYGSSSVPSFS